jgi:hypothetical protein
VSQPCSTFLQRGGLDTHQQGAHPQPPYFTHRVAIELSLLWLVRADDGAALSVLHVAPAATGQHPRGHRQPSDNAPRSDGHDIEQPVVWLGGCADAGTVRRSWPAGWDR